jgi:HTH-type transcriptional regulator/antitoxin HipB
MPRSSQPISTTDQVRILLQSARKSRQLTQDGLARRLGISQARLSELERAPGTLSLEQLLALCQQLGLQLSIHHRDAAAEGATAAGDATPPQGGADNW